MNNLGERLYELRTEHEMSQGNLAEKLDVSRQTISKWENNISIPELDKIIALSRVFDVSVDYLVKGEGVAPTADIIETVYEEATETVPQKMITINPTKRLFGGLSIAMGLINSIPLIPSLVQRITVLSMQSPMLEHIESLPEFILSVVSTLLLSVALFSQKDKFISIALILRGVMSLTHISGLFSAEITYSAVTTVIGVVATILTAVGYITAKKSNAKIYMASVITMRVIGFVVMLIGSYMNFVTLFNTGVLNAVISTFNTTIFAWLTLFVNISLAVLINLKGNPKTTYEVPENAYPEHSEMYIGMVKYVLLSLFTFGVYNCIWTYRLTENLNCGDNQIQSGAKKLLLCIFVPFYRLYWYYNQSRRLENLMRAKDMHTSDFAVVTLILAIFVPIVAASAFLQSKANEYAIKFNETKS